MPSTGPVGAGTEFAPALASALVAFLLYALTACRTIFVGDSAELAAAASCFGVPHPPGYPLYTLVTGLWAHLFPISQRALAANLASALHGALAVGLLVLLLRRAGLSRVSCFAAAAVLALGRSTWAQSVAAEVYAFDLALLGGATWTVARSVERPGTGSRVLAGLVAGLWLGHRFLNLLYLPAVWWVARGIAGAGRTRTPSETGPGSRSSRGILPVALGLVASGLVYVYLPIASGADPPIDIGDPQTLGRFLTVVRGGPYLRHLEGTTPALAAARLVEHLRALPLEAGFGLALGVFGLVVAGRRGHPRRTLARGAALLLGTNLLIAALYNVLDIASYRLPGAFALAVLAAIGAEALLLRRSMTARARRTQAAAAILVLCGLGLPLNFRANDLHRENAARRYGEAILRSTPGDALLLTEGDTVTHVLWYLQAVERQAPGVMIVSTGHAGSWYFDQLSRRHPGQGVPSFEPGEAPATVYRRLLEGTGERRPVAFTFSPNRLAALTAGRWWGERTVVPVGLVLEARRREAPFDRDSLATANAALWDGIRAELPRVGPRADLETQAIGFEYALAMERTAEFLDRCGRREEAQELYRGVLQLAPDRWEKNLAAAYRRIGRTNPSLSLEGLARRALGADPKRKG